MAQKKPVGMSSQRTNETIVSITVSKYRVNQSHVEFVVECVGTTQVWQVFRRYQQFRELHDALKKRCPWTSGNHCDSGAVPVLPGTNWNVTNADPELIEKRRKLLEIYLQQLLVPRNTFYQDCPEVKNFLHADEMPLFFKSKMSKPVPGLGIPLEADKTGKVEDIFADETEEDRDRSQVMASRLRDDTASAIAPGIPKFDMTSGTKTYCDMLQQQSEDFIGAIGLAQVSCSPQAGTAATNALQARTDDGPDEAASGAVTLASGPHEICGGCGHIMVITYDIDEWQSFGLCDRCNEYTEHTLHVPEDAPNTAGDDPQAPEDVARAVAKQNEHDETTTLDEDQQVSAYVDDPADEAELLRLSMRLKVRCDVYLDQFEFITTLGRGTFGKVMKARFKPSDQVFAVKVLSKSAVNQKRMVEYIREEKEILAALNGHPFIVGLHFAFQTDHHLYLVMDFLPGGELYTHIRPATKGLPEAVARFYIAELVLAVEHLQRNDIAHRDLKPENIVLDWDGHIKLADFGLARRNFRTVKRFSFVGSAEYLSPEVIRGEKQTLALDWWTVGGMLFEMLTGKTPFTAATNKEVYTNILNHSINLQHPNLRPAAADLIQKLLDKNAKTRLRDPAKIKAHPFFTGIEWAKALQKGLTPPFVPDLSSNDTKYFSKEFTSEWATLPTQPQHGRATLDELTRRFSNFHKIANADRAAAVAAASKPLAVPKVASKERKSSSLSSNGQTPQNSGLDRAASGERTPQSSPELQQHSQSFEDPNADRALTMIDPQQLVGVWRLLRVEMVSESGQVSFPWGAEVAGQLIYTKNGLYSMQMSPIKRPKPLKPERPSREEMSDAYVSYVALFGNFFVMPGRSFIVHTATSSLASNLVNVLQKRYFHLEGDQLTLLTTHFMTPNDRIRAQTATTWQKLA